MKKKNKEYIIIEDIENIIHEKKIIDQIQSILIKKKYCVIKNVIEKEWIKTFKKYLVNIGKNSLPNYKSISPLAPNSHRININDERSYVKGTFHQFVFYPWNQDLFNLFKKTEDIFFLKNLINGIRKDKFLKNGIEDNCTARIAVQFYPSGQGFLNTHIDPIGHHQLTVPMIMMSSKGIDYFSGGGKIINQSNKKIDIDSLCEAGDMILSNASSPHCVDIVDKNLTKPWLEFRGRWVMLFAVNKIDGNDEIKNSKELLA